MRSGLFWKLFLLQLLAATAVLAGALAFSRTFSVRGFGEYLESRERVRVQEIAVQIAQDYRRTGDLMAAAEKVAAIRERGHWRPEGPMPEGPPVADEPPESPHHHPGEGIPRLQLEDANGEWLRGDRRPLRLERLREPITVDGKVVGYLAWPRFPMFPEQEEFAHKQAQHLAVIAPIALVVAALFAALITALIVKPIRQLSSGAAALARREFGTRLPEQRRDELGQLAADFNRLAAALEGYDSRQRQWLADIAHELRTPVAVLRGELEAVLDGVRPASVEGVRSLQQEVKRLESLIQDLHLVSLAESGGLRLTLAEADVGELVQDAAARFRERFAAKDFVVRVNAEPGLRASVDAQRFEQVLANLLENALLHANAPGPVTITARAEPGWIAISVADAGPGVSPEALPRLFDRLYRVENARARPSGGAGLGLSICKSIVEAHGGTIGAAKSAGGGLEIVARLPRP